MKHAKGRKRILKIGIIGLCILIWAVLVYRRNVTFHNREIYMEEETLVKNNIQIHDVKAEVYDPSVLIHNEGEGMENYLVQDASVDYMNYGGMSRYMIVSFCITNHSAAVIKLKDICFPLGVKTVSWYQGYDPWGLKLMENPGEVNPGESIIVRIPITLMKEMMGEKNWNRLGEEGFELILSIDNDFYDIPFQIVTVYLGTDEENRAFMKKVEEYAKEFGL